MSLVEKVNENTLKPKSKQMKKHLTMSKDFPAGFGILSSQVLSVKEVRTNQLLESLQFGCRYFSKLSR